MDSDSLKKNSSSKKINFSRVLEATLSTLFMCFVTTMLWFNEDVDLLFDQQTLYDFRLYSLLITLVFFIWSFIFISVYKSKS